MKAKFDKYGRLYYDRGNGYENALCPYDRTRQCSGWCALMPENKENHSEIFHPGKTCDLKLCNNQVIQVEEIINEVQAKEDKK